MSESLLDIIHTLFMSSDDYILMSGKKNTNGKIILSEIFCI